jgi:hypothetical protein
VTPTVGWRLLHKRAEQAAVVVVQSDLECEPSQVLVDRQPVKTQRGDSVSVVVNCSEL